GRYLNRRTSIRGTRIVRRCTDPPFRPWTVNTYSPGTRCQLDATESGARQPVSANRTRPTELRLVVPTLVRSSSAAIVFDDGQRSPWAKRRALNMESHAAPFSLTTISW